MTIVRLVRAAYPRSNCLGTDHRASRVAARRNFPTGGGGGGWFDFVVPVGLGAVPISWLGWSEALSIFWGQPVIVKNQSLRRGHHRLGVVIRAPPIGTRFCLRTWRRHHRPAGSLPTAPT